MKIIQIFFQQMKAVTDNMTPCKTKRVKANTPNLFHREVLENTNIRDKLLKRSKKSDLISNSRTKQQNIIH